MPKQRAVHYGTPEHEAWSQLVIERAGYRCEGFDHDERTPRQGVKLYADHITELQDGGAPLDPANGQALCARCHGRKTARARAARLGA